MPDRLAVIRLSGLADLRPPTMGPPTSFVQAFDPGRRVRLQPRTRKPAPLPTRGGARARRAGSAGQDLVATAVEHHPVAVPDHPVQPFPAGVGVEGPDR